jgi:L-lactate dehydrogenase complex protein LldE
MTVNIFIPCIVDQLYPKTAENMEKVLRHFGIETHYIEEQTCCGQIAYKNGYSDHAQELGSKFIKEFNNGQHIVIPAVSCAVMIRKYYPKIFYNSSQHNDLKHMLPKVFEFTDFLFHVAGIQTLNTRYNAQVAIHTSCSGLRDYGNADVMHNILSTVEGLQILPLKDADVCCGFGGSFAVKNHHISAAMAQEKLQNAMDTGAQYLVSNDASCLMHLQSYAKKQKLPVTPVHIADFIALILNL